MTTSNKQYAQENQQEKLHSKNTSSDPRSIHSIHKAVVSQLHKRRQGNANCKTRSEVKGGGKKPWKQKGTGKARAGSSRSPLWRGGGVIFGPKSKKYNQKINKKERKLAIKNTLENKQNAIITINKPFLDFNKPKTKAFLDRVKKLDIHKQEKLLIIVEKKHRNTYLSVRNLKNVEIIEASQINLLSIIAAKHILIEQDATKIVKKMYHE